MVCGENAAAYSGKTDVSRVLNGGAVVARAVVMGGKVFCGGVGGKFVDSERVFGGVAVVGKQCLRTER